jgi:hypothetical protein
VLALVLKELMSTGAIDTSRFILSVVIYIVVFQNLLEKCVVGVVRVDTAIFSN